MSNIYALSIGDRVNVTLTDGSSYTMTVSRIDVPGTMGTSHMGGPYVLAHIRPGGYSVYLGSSEVAHWEPVSTEAAPERGYVAHTLTPDEVAKVPAGQFTMVTYAEMLAALALPSTERPRVYAYLTPEGDQRYGQITRLSSLHYVERYADRLAFAWISGTTSADLIGRA